MRWGVRKERETHTFYRPESCLFSWVARLLWKSNNVCGLHRLPCEGPEWNNSEKSTFLITVSLKQEILTLGYFEDSLSHHTTPEYRRLWICSVSVSLFFGEFFWGLISLSKRYRGTKDMITLLLTCFHFIPQCWTSTPCQE